MDSAMVMLVTAMLIGLIPAAIASSKGRSFLLWWLYGSLIFIVAIIHALIMKPVESEVGGRNCPFCAERIKAEAIICKHCGRESEPQASKALPPTSDAGSFLVVVFVVVVIIILSTFTFLR